MAYDDMKRQAERTAFIKALDDEKDTKGKELSQEAKDKQIELFDAETEALKENSTRMGKGLRVRTGMTRGKGSMVIKWEAFDDANPDTLPKSIEEFAKTTGVSSEPELVEFLITGFNDAQYTAASDPIAEFVNPAWDKDTQNQFRLVVRNYSRATGTSIEDTVTLIKPGVEKAFAAKAGK